MKNENPKIQFFCPNLNPEPSKLKLQLSAARFVTALNEYNINKDKLTLFSGDLFFPSFLSDINNGQQMVLPFNRMNVDVSCLGNHEVEYGIELAEKLI